jgi:hypothetical protein
MENKGVYRVLVGKSERKRPLRRLGVDRKIILRCIFRNGMWEYGLNRAGSGQGQVAGSSDRGNEPSGCIKYGEFLDYLKTG